MCDVCHQTPCNSRCPNHVAKTIYVCKICHTEIEEGDEYYEMDNEFYHADCFEDKAVEILMEQCGAIKGVAELEEEEW